MMPKEKKLTKWTQVCLIYRRVGKRHHGYPVCVRQYMNLTSVCPCPQPPPILRIKKDGFTPDATSYYLIISACASIKKVGLGMLHYGHMKAAGHHLPPNIRNDILRACAKTKRTKEAAQILRDTEVPIRR